MRPRSDLILVWPLAALAFGALLLLGASLLFGARQIDDVVRHREQHLVERGILGQGRELENALAGQTVWDAAVVNLDNRLDPEWARKNLPVYLRPTIGHWDYLVINPDNQPIWASNDMLPTPRSGWAPFARRAAPLIAEMRELERKRGPVTRSRGDGKTDRDDSVVITRFEARPEGAYMWLASLVEPDFGRAKLSRPRATIVLAGGPITAANMSTIQSIYGLQNVRFETDPARIRSDEARVRLPIVGGSLQMNLVWTPQHPGRDLLRASAWVLSGVMVTLVALGVLMLMRTRKAALDLIAIHQAQAEFLANMSHEIRTPLNGVNAIAEALTRALADGPQKAMAQTIHSSGQMLERLLTDILDLARIDAGGLKVEREPFQLAEAVSSVIELMGARARGRGLELRLDLDPAAETTVAGDVTRLKQVLTNLISNAIKFTDQGHVGLTVRREGDGEMWRFAVEDTGIGFDGSVKDRLFQRFQQGDGSVTRRFGGTGLGLAISRDLAARMGGDLDGEGEPGVGAIFTLTLPLPQVQQVVSAANEAQVALPITPEGPSLRVLVSEDHPVNRMVLEMVLAEIGADIRSTENGLEALEAFEAESFDLILMDMQMPVMDGLTAIRRIRALEAERGLPRTTIIMVTANAMPEHRSAGMSAGADLFVTKPIDGLRLIEMISQLRSAEAA